MSTIESLDLASLTNNPQSIASALEDVLETTNNNIGLLKQQAQSDADDIQNTHLVNAQNDANSINNLLLGLTPEHYYTDSLSNGWTPWDTASNTSDEGGVRIFKYGKLYIAHFMSYNNQGTGVKDSVIINVSGNITLPSNNVRLGLGGFQNGTENDYVVKVLLKTDGDIHVYSNSNDNDYHHLVGNYVGIDIST